MTDNIVPSNSTQSPFDSIRRYRADGSEYWLARELMSLMGYTRWSSFETPIAAAIENLELNDDAVSDHFCDLTRKSAGRDASDYEMTRYAAYMTALCCDGRKPEVAAAKKYFATKTREAEVNQAKPQAPVLPSRELALETARSVFEIKDLLSDTDPRLCQMLVDVAINDAIQTIKVIAPASETTWMGVSEIAESLKLPVTMQNRAPLGKFVKALCGELGKQESRLCNGRLTPIWCYPMPNDEVESAVRKFFN